MLMCRRLVTCTVLGFLIALCAGCDNAQPTLPDGPRVEFPAESAPAELPVPPLSLNAPKDLPGNHGGKDFSRMELEELQTVARNSARRGEFSTALRARFWSIKKGDEEYYDLACMYARNGMSDEAFYWLQIAA